MKENEFLLMDENKNFAIVKAVSLNMLTKYSSHYIKNLTTGKVVKHCNTNICQFPREIPIARPINGYNKLAHAMVEYAKVICGSESETDTRVITIGYEADNGFKIPNEKMLKSWVVL